MCASYLRVLLAFALAPSAAAAGSRNFRSTGQVHPIEVEDIFNAEMSDKYHHVGAFEDHLRKMYTSLPKNVYGNLGHETIRYALRRYFMNRYGWLISGLEADSPTGWVPAFVVNALEGRAGVQGIDLHGLATLTATLEDIVDKTSEERLATAMQITFDENRSSYSMAEADDVMETYVIMSLSPSKWIVSHRGSELTKKKQFFREHKESQFKTIVEWYAPLRERHLGALPADAEVSQETLVKLSIDLDKNFHHYFDIDCSAMKKVLSKHVGRRAGRLRLAAFYNMSLYAEWEFDEKEEYLRALGALDETANPASVIIANYALGKHNCLNETSLYAVCCRNTCEDLMTSLEDHIGAPSASEDVIARFVAELPSESKKAPRELPAELLARLSEVAALHGGRVPLHGRLFAMWMHHAYPLECPFPHEAGTTRASTAEEWMAQTGQSSQKTEAELQQVIEADTCSLDAEGKVDCGEEITDLPWSMREELLVVSMDSGASYAPLLALLCVFPAVLLAVPLLRGGIDAGFNWSFVRKSLPMQVRAVAVVVLLSLVAFLADLLDGLLFAVAFASCLFMLGMSFASQHVRNSTCLPTQVKKV